jgi:hypothetical protein
MQGEKLQRQQLKFGDASAERETCKIHGNPWESQRVMHRPSVPVTLTAANTKNLNSSQSTLHPPNVRTASTLLSLSLSNPIHQRDAPTLLLYALLLFCQFIFASLGMAGSRRRRQAGLH